MKKTVEETDRFALNVASKQGWELVWDSSFTSGVVEGLTHNFNHFGYYLCPCREGWGDRQQDKDVICPCDYSKADVDEYGHCYCGLFASAEFNQSKKDLEQIPERRPEELLP